MTADRSPAILRRLASLLIRGPEARFIRADMEDAFDRDLARGIPMWRSRWRYGCNILASTLSIWREGLRPSGFTLSWLDVKLALRMLVKYPGLTCVALFALSIGIPAGIAPLHVANAIEAPLPVEESDRVRSLLYWNAGRRVPTTFDDFARWRDTLTSFEAPAAWRAATYNVEAAGTVAPVAGAEVTASTFEVLRVQRLLGRALQAEDETIGGPLVAVIGHDLWRSRFGGDSGIVGRAMRIGNSVYTVVGVMPGDFFFPARQQLWLPLRERLAASPRQPPPLAIFGRLRDGVSPEEAQAEVNATGVRRHARAKDSERLDAESRRPRAHGHPFSARRHAGAAGVPGHPDRRARSVAGRLPERRAAHCRADRRPFIRVRGADGARCRPPANRLAGLHRDARAGGPGDRPGTAPLRSAREPLCTAGAPGTPLLDRSGSDDDDGGAGAWARRRQCRGGGRRAGPQAHGAASAAEPPSAPARSGRECGSAGGRAR